MTKEKDHTGIIYLAVAGFFILCLIAASAFGALVYGGIIYFGLWVFRDCVGIDIREISFLTCWLIGLVIALISGIMIRRS